MQVVTLDVAAIERSAQSGTLIVYQSADVLFICFVNTVPTGPATPFPPLRVQLSKQLTENAKAAEVAANQVLLAWRDRGTRGCPKRKVLQM